MMERAEVEWVNTTSIMPNPLNPRRNDAIKTEEMQEIITRRGWEEPLTVYKKGSNYVVLAGHRRLFAAKQMSVKQIPVFIVSEPANHQEEIERIASLQRGRVDWTPYEWAKFTYERWLAWNRPNISEFADQIGIPRKTADDYLRVLDYFPRPEIEARLLSESITFNRLVKLIAWIRRLKREKRELVEDMSEEMIRRLMLAKLENGIIESKDELTVGEKFVDEASDEEMREFLTTPTMSVREAMHRIGVSDEKEIKTFHGHLTQLGKMNRRVFNMKPTNKQELDMMEKQLVDLKKTIEQRLEAMKVEVHQLI